MPGRTRADIAPGMKVKGVKKEDQGTGKLTEGGGESLLTKSPHHPRGIKVRLVGGEVGRVQEIPEE